MGSADVYEKTIRHPKLWDPMDGVGVLWRYLLQPLTLASWCVPQALVLARKRPFQSRPQHGAQVHPCAGGEQPSQRQLLPAHTGRDPANGDVLASIISNQRATVIGIGEG